MPRLPMEIPAQLHELHPDLPPAIFGDSFRRSCERLDRYVGALALELAATLGLPPGEPLTPDALLAARGWNPRGRLALAWLLETLELYGSAERAGEAWLLAAGAPRVPSAELRAAAEAATPSARPAFEVLALSAHALPAVLRGELRGEEALFSPATVGLWFDYFSNSNPHYAPNNAVTGVAVARVARPAAAVFEFGGGSGSAALMILRALVEEGKPPARYLFSELQPAFLRRGARAVQAAVPAGCALATTRFDINAGPAEQGIDLGQFDVVFGVNTAHLAHDVLRTLGHLRALLRPGGALVLGELMRPTPTAPVHLELPFTLLEAYGNVPPLEGIRSRPGFLSPSGWTRALEAAGFNGIAVLPARIERCARIYPGFYCGALVARA